MYGRSGRTAYTESVLSIIQDVLSEQPASSPHTGSSSTSTTSQSGEFRDYHQYCPQAQYANGLKARHTGYPTYHSSVKDNNRFRVFNTNQGNM